MHGRSALYCPGIIAGIGVVLVIVALLVQGHKGGSAGIVARARSLAHWQSAAGDVAAARGIGPDGVPYYVTRRFSPAERALLSSAYGIADPNRLYFSDSTPDAVLKYDTQAKRCYTCYVDSYRVGFLSLRRPGESWSAFETRARAVRRRDVPPGARAADQSLDDLDPAVQPYFRTLLDDGRRAGFRLTIAETYRSPTREALLFAEGHGRTYTATSMHSYGRAVDIVVDDGRAGRATTRADWIRFRRFVLARPGVHFRVLGRTDHTWDWPHVELPSATLGFHSIDDALAFAALCTSDSARAHAPSPKQLGGAASDPCVFVPNLPGHAATP